MDASEGTTDIDKDRLASSKNGYTAFFYGTLMHPRILHRVVDSTDNPTPTQLSRFTHTPALLTNFCRHKVRFCDYPGVVAESEKSVRGVYVAGLNDSDMRLLDFFEGSQYEKEEVEVELLRGETLSGEGDGESKDALKGQDRKERELVKTQTYVFKDRLDLENEEWDFEEFKKEKLHNWVGFASEEYQEVDAAGDDVSTSETSTGHDPTGGRGINSTDKA